MFRPSVERGIRLTAPDGYFGIVLPDIVLLKENLGTRRLILEELAFTRLDWWGMVFQDAVIDAATVIGQKGSAGEDHRLHAPVHATDSALSQEIPQRQLWRHEHLTFHLHPTNEKRGSLEHLAVQPKLGDCVEIHEGVHSRNILSQLFVRELVDDSCGELYFGRVETRPDHLRWKGWYIRLSTGPAPL